MGELRITTSVATAEWSEPDGFTLEHLFEAGTVWLGRSPRGDREPQGYCDDCHICLISGTRAGKDVTDLLRKAWS